MERYIGIELGSTRIKAVEIDGAGNVLGTGSHTWENRYDNGLWTYTEQDVWQGLRASVADLLRETPHETVSAMGVSAMMHGYIALNANGEMLVPFRTWRNTDTAQAAEALTKAFGVNIPMRWSIAHLYQAVLRDEPHVKEIAHITTLAGYVHYKLTGEMVLGVGDASGMFPIDTEKCDYDAAMLDTFDALVAEKGYPWKIRALLPKVLPAGVKAGALTETGAKRLDPRGTLKAGIALCPPEGDAGTGMVATDSIRPRTGNVSAGTSVFAMVVLEKPLAALHTEIDTVTTPDGRPVAMVHCNNCTSDINAWVGLLHEAIALAGGTVGKGELTTKLFTKALEGDADCGGLTSYNFFSGEPVVGLTEGRPLLTRRPSGELRLADLMKSFIYSSVASLSIGMRALREENVRLDEMYGHGGFFKTPAVGQRAMSAAVGAPVTVMENAGEGGAWGIALLAALTDRQTTLAAYLDAVFGNARKNTVQATERDRADFDAYIARYARGLRVEQCAAETL